MKRFLALPVVAALLVSLLAASASAMPAAVEPLEQPTGEISPEVQDLLDRLGPDEMATVIVTLNDQADPAAIGGSNRKAKRAAIVRELKRKSREGQREINKLIRAWRRDGKVERTKSFWVVNAISVTGTADVIHTLAERTDIATVTPDDLDLVPTAGTPAANQALINAPALWNSGHSGQGVVIAHLDTGVYSPLHPDLEASWRGGAGDWFDPYGQHTTDPFDNNGHGTETLSVIVGGEVEGASIGTAPGAQWIAARVFDDSGSGTASAIHQAFQWVLDPDGDPNTDDAPDVVNNSWSFGSAGCNTVFQADIQALRAAGIVPVFAAGNFANEVSPANYPESLAVGAVDNADVSYNGSGLGPSACGEPSTTYPELVGPGVDIGTITQFGFYQSRTGTSLAAPHVSGALALLMSSSPSVTGADAEAALLATAVDLGSPGPDNIFGHGRIDIAAALAWLGTPPVDVTGPATSNVTFAGGTLTASVNDTATGGSTVTAAEYYIDSTTGTATSMAPADGAFDASSEAVTASVTLTGGTHTLHVRGQDAAGNWGPFDSVVVVPDTVGPATSLPTLSPNPSNGSGGVALAATADDTATGGSDVTAAEYFIGADPGAGSAMAMTVGTPGVTATASATIPSGVVSALADGNHVVSVRSIDSAGNWGAEATIDLVVDRTAPVVASVAASPNPTGGASPVSLSATATDGASDVTAAEWFTGTDPGDGNATAMTVSGPTPWDLTASIDVSTWADGSYDLNVRAQDAVGNWSTTLTTTVVVETPTAAPSLYFSTLGNATVPTVSGADDADVYNWDGSSFSRAVDATALASALPAGQKVDALVWVSPTEFYVSLAGGWNFPGPGKAQDEDVLHYDNGTWSVFFDGTAHGLGGSGGRDVDAISIVDGTLYFSTLGNVSVGGLGSGDDADIYSWNGTSMARVWDASANGLPGKADINGLHVVDSTHFYMTFVAGKTNVPTLGNVQDEDVVFYDAGSWSVHFNGTAEGLNTSSGQDLDAIDIS